MMKTKLEIIKEIETGLQSLRGDQLVTPALDSSVSALGLALLQVFIDIRDTLEHLLIELQGRP